MKRFIYALTAIGLVGVNMLTPAGLGSVQPALAADEDTGTPWVVAAPGRVEPNGGMIKIGTAIIGRVADVGAPEGSVL